MKQYFKNILSAICGRNPLQVELDAALRRERSMQRLVENLRERTRDKDALIKRMDEEYRQQILELTKNVKQQ